MNKFEINRQKLKILNERIEKNGMNDEVYKELLSLYSESCIFIVLGPNQNAREIINENENPNEKDLEYYRDTFKNINYAHFFNIKDLGTPKIVYKEVKFNEIIYPTFRIYWEDKVSFINQCNTEIFRKTIKAQIDFFNSIMGAQWLNWRVEFVDEF